MQIEIGNWLFAFYWRDWVLAALPAMRRGRNAWAEGTAICIGPFRIVKYPSDQP